MHTRLINESESIALYIGADEQLAVRPFCFCFHRLIE